MANNLLLTPNLDKLLVPARHGSIVGRYWPRPCRVAGMGAADTIYAIAAPGPSPAVRTDLGLRPQAKFWQEAAGGSSLSMKNREVDAAHWHEYCL